MRAFLALLRVNFQSLLITTLSIGRRGKKKKRSYSGVGAFLLLGFLMLFISTSYSFSLGFAFSALGALDVLMVLMVLMSIAFPFVFIVFAAQSMVFSQKDMDLVFSLPVSPFKIMLSRLLALYLETALMCELLLIPAGIAYLVFGGSGGVLFMLALLVEGLFLAFIPTTLALIIGTFISFVVSRLPFKNLFITLFSLLAVALVFVGSFSLSFTANHAMVNEVDVQALYGTITGAFPPLGWAVNGMLGNGWAFLLLCAVCLLPFLALTWIFSLFYKSMLTHLSSHRQKGNYKLRRLSAQGSFAALFKKEAGRFFGTPAYLLNSGVGTLMTLVLCIMALVNKKDITNFLALISGQLGAGTVNAYLPPLLLAGVLFLVGMNFISCVSISLEGKTLWILKSSPISTGRIFAAKAGFSALFGAASILICIPILGVAFSLSVPATIMMLLLGVLVCVLTSMLGLYANLLFPRMDAENDTIVIKQSVSAIITMILDIVLLLLLGGLYFLLHWLGAGFLVYTAVAGAFVLLLVVLTGLLLRGKGARIFMQL